jgi:GTPase
VLDVSNPNFETHHATTLAVLAELGAASQTILTVFNKTDLADEPMRLRALHLVPDALFVSARTGDGLDALKERCRELVAGQSGTTEMLVPHDRYDVIARLHKLGHIHTQEHRDDGVWVQGRFPSAQTGFFEPFVLKK